MNIQKRLPDNISVDLIRTVAIISVILLHVTIFVTNISPIQDGLEVVRGLILTGYMSFGRMGVPLFIILDSHDT